MLPSTDTFDQLPLFFEGNSRILKQTAVPEILICKLKPTVFSLKENGSMLVPGIDTVRTKLNAMLCNLLHQQGIKTSTIRTEGAYIFMEKHEVAPIEVVVKSALIGSPKHIYKGIMQATTRSDAIMPIRHQPYVRFDWRNSLPFEDSCMPKGLADFFIDTSQAEITALKAFDILQNHFQTHDLDLLDICFFMNKEGNVICAEISTDNCRLNYTGNDASIKTIFESKDKSRVLDYAQAVLALLEAQQ